jgi:NADH:ubiquinone oxidoreductase subunit H
MDSFIVVSLIKTVMVFAVLLTTLAYLQWVERKVIAHIQVRPGPYAWARTGCCSRWPTSSSC